ncbi:MAG: RluA family pseudouridine synthase [Burkholderiaceae bacterium]|nr:MAG: RluA family pseudouridine synthase [Burkholderiaceae bacterium]
MNHLGKQIEDISQAVPLPEQVQYYTVDEEAVGQRIDNLLLRLFKGVPKSHVYRIVRSGEVRVNKGRIGADYKLVLGDVVRIPPMRFSPKNEAPQVPASEFPVLFEDTHLLIINKPAGTAVHGGSGVSFGVIEQLRAARPQAKFLELVHRLDRETSGILLLAKKRSALTALHEVIRAGQMEKRYFVLVHGLWQNERQHVRLALHKFTTAEGDRRVVVRDDGQAAHTIFNRIETFRDTPWGDFTLLEADLKTGRTHQIRVHLSHLGFPIVGDEKYGDFARNKSLLKEGSKRMFLHAHHVELDHPHTGERLLLDAPLPPACESFINRLRSAGETL